LESILHGGEVGHIHDTDDTNTNAELNGEQMKFKTFDPDTLLHGGADHDHSQTSNKEHKERRQLQEEEVNKFKKWMKNRLLNEKNEQDVGSWGFKFPYISDSVLEYIKQLKHKFLGSSELHKKVREY
jgi:alkaline phosphatase